MLVGIIATIVIVLLIVTLMSTGSTSGSGGVDQTKATKVMSEAMALAQAIGFYKTTTGDGSYAGLSMTNLVSSGIINASDTDDVTGVASTKINSKALSNVTYVIAPATGNGSVVLTISSNLNETTDKSLLSALRKSSNSAGASAIAFTTGTTGGDIGTITFR